MKMMPTGRAAGLESEPKSLDESGKPSHLQRGELTMSPLILIALVAAPVSWLLLMSLGFAACSRLRSEMRGIAGEVEA